MPTTADTSARFKRAAAGERDRLARQLERLTRDVEELEARLTRVHSERHALQERIASIDGLLGPTAPAPSPSEPETPDARTESALVALRGSAIRTHAVKTLVESGNAESPIHYREWLGLLEKAGYTVAGKRPEAVFLSQVSRSPVVVATTRAGIYRVDREAIVRMRKELQDLQRKLADSAISAPRGASELGKRSAEQRRLTQAIGRVERALEEAERSLEINGEPRAKLAA